MSLPASPNDIVLRGVRHNNLKGFDLRLPAGKLIVLTGLSGSGKSSLAFDTLYAEGQRRYVETFSPYARQFFERMDKPRVDSIEGIPPAIAIEQRNAVRTTRSTVGTMTEVCDYMKALWPHVSTPFCPSCRRAVRQDYPNTIWQEISPLWPGAEVLILFEVPLARGIELRECLGWVRKQGYQRLWFNGHVQRLEDLDTDAADSASMGSLMLVQDRLRLVESSRARLVEACEQAFHFGRGKLRLLRLDPSGSNEERKFSRALECSGCGRSIAEPSPSLFSFNHPRGACPQCKGFGRVIAIDYRRALPDHGRTLRQGVVKPWLGGHGLESQRDLLKFCKRRGVPMDVPFRELSAENQRWVVEGDPGYGSDPEHEWPHAWYGVKGYFRWLESKSYRMHYRVFLARYRAYDPCPACQGNRFQPDALLYRMEGTPGGGGEGGITLADYYRLTVSRALGLVRQFTLPSHLGRVAGESLRTVWREVEARLAFLEEVGLGYLTLDRPTKTLSGGETERVNLTTCLGAHLVNSLFVLDEPSVGLHPRDTARLVRILRRLRDAGNTVVVVEHEAEVMRAADHLVDLGPGRGEAGGHIVFQGNWAELMRHPDSLTGAYLSGRARIGGGRARVCAREDAALTVHVRHRHNLRNERFRFPLGKLVCVTGVSGSGKTTLIQDVLLPLLQEKFAASSVAPETPGSGEGGEESENLADSAEDGLGEVHGWEVLSGVVWVDQSALARTPRSNPSGYVGAWDDIRRLFALSDDAVREELDLGSFSFNSSRGQCERCRGAGYEKVEMQFLSDLFIRCPACEGKRFRPHVLKARVRPSSSHPGWNAAEMLEATVDEAVAFLELFEHCRPAAAAARRLLLLQSIGLGYLRLGQPLNTLSGGESQRLKLVGHLAEAAERTGAARKLQLGDENAKDHSSPASQAPLLFLIDEPTTGLHFDDVRLLLAVLQRLVDAGHSLVVVEHHLGVLQAADWILDLGPEAGDAGGRVVVEGPPEAVAACLESHTGRALREERRSIAGALERADVPDLAAAMPAALMVRGAREHNLKNLDADLPRDCFVVLTGVSGSGKSTLAFDLVFNEGQRRFLDCMSAYARQFVERMERPDVDAVLGLPPTVSIEQRNTRGGAKSTVATVTEVYHFLRLLLARLGVQHCPQCGHSVGSQTRDEIVARLRTDSKARGPLKLLAPLVRHRKGFHSHLPSWAAARGYSDLRVDGRLVSTQAALHLDRFTEHSIEVVTGTCAAGGGAGRRDAIRLRGLVERTLELGGGTMLALDRKGRASIHSVERACGTCGRSFETLDPKHFSYHSPQGWCPRCRGFGELFYLPETDRGARADAIEESWFLWQEGKREPCPDCSGARLNEVARAVRLPYQTKGGGVKGRSLSPSDLASFTVEGALDLFQKIRFQGRAGQVARDIVPEIRERLRFMTEVGLGYLQLGRAAGSLSGGESQRVRLAAQLGSNLSGVLYVLDEPTIGLHSRDNEQLLAALARLRARGNSLLVVEHDEETMRHADHVLDLGPGAGEQGGRIVAQGTLADLENSEHSITGQCLREKRVIPARGSRRQVFPEARISALARRVHESSSAMVLREAPGPRFPAPDAPEPGHPWLRLRGASQNNLRDLDVAFPLGRWTTVTGVSGSGKSTLVKECLLPAVRVALSRSGKRRPISLLSGWEGLRSAYEVDQSPIGRTPRSIPATYVGFFDDIRKLFALAPEAKMRGYGPGRFSFNSASGRCAVCEGSGQIKLEMNFLPPAYARCEACHGRRFTPETIEVRWQGKSIDQVLELTAREAVDFFEAHPRIRRPLQALVDTGLGYLKLGQTSPTLSGGEAQRLKLVTHLLGGLKTGGAVESAGQGHLFVLEEPTIGLHMLDVRKLVEVLQRLVDGGHTVIVIEHNLDLIAESDWIIDLGPEGGSGGGRVVAAGTPEQVAEIKTSHTGRYLKKYFAAHRRRQTTRGHKVPARARA